MNPGKLRYRATFYRRSGTATEDARGRETKAWAAVATNVPCTWEMASGRLGQGPTGQTVEVAAVVKFRAAEASTVRAGDGCVISDGALPVADYIVHRCGPDRKLRRYRAAMLRATDEVIP